MTHIFISYSRRDREYARKLVDDLLARGFDVWFDERITYGANWEQAIFKAIDTCAVLVVLMSPDAAASEWVPREIAYAEQRRKPIFPLLLAGEVFPRLILMQYADVTNRALPPDAFYQTISTFAPPGAAAGTHISTAEPGQSQTSRPAETVTRERRLESAMPRQSQRGVPTEVRVKVSLLDSAGLRGELPDLTEYGDEIKKGDVRASGFPLAFPLDYDGRALPVDACILVSADRYRVRYPTNPCGEDGAEVQIPPDHDSRTVIFTLEPLDNAYTGRAAVTVRLVREGRVIAENQVVTRVVAEVTIGQVAYVVATSGAVFGGLAGVVPGVPPPQVTKSVAPDFDSMTPDEIMVWMESLAKRQGANEGFTTNANQDIPEIDPDSVVIDEPGYIPYGEEERARKPGIPAPPLSPRPVSALSRSVPLSTKPPPSPVPEPPPQPVAAEPEVETPIELAIGQNALEWLESLAADNSMDIVSEDDMSLETIERAIAEGRVTFEQMKRFQEYQMERAAQRTDVDEDEFDLDAPAEPTELPDWLAGVEAVEGPPVVEAPTNLQPIEMLFGQPLPTETTEPIPSWLQDDGSEAETIENIFTAEPPKTAASIELDDQFGQTVYEEQDEQVPDWYLRNTTDPRRIEVVEGTASVGEPALQATPSAPEVPMIQGTQPVPPADAALPSETSLPAGEHQSLPLWMSAASTQTTEAESLPDWLMTDEHPIRNLDWLTPEAEEPASHFEFEPVPEPVTITTKPPPPAVTISTLEEARQRYKSGDLKGSLALYEALVRASQSLTEVTSDLMTLAQSHKDPVLFRVLGDSLMRVGRLQDALNIYRQALNLL